MSFLPEELEHLQDLPPQNPHLPPEGWETWPGLSELEKPDQDCLIAAYMEYLRQYLLVGCADKMVLKQLQNLWVSGLTMESKPDWVYLMGSDLENHQLMTGWVNTLVEDLRCNEEACIVFCNLLQKSSESPHDWPECGYYEGCRILAHIFKDKREDAKACKRSWKVWSWSNFLKNSCEEAMEALEQPDAVRTLKRKTKKRKGPGNVGRTATGNDWKGHGK